MILHSSSAFFVELRWLIIDQPKRVHHLTLIFAISEAFIENESRILINFTIITNQIKLDYTLQTPFQMC
jgi:hypothetical protein